MNADKFSKMELNGLKYLKGWVFIVIVVAILASVKSAYTEDIAFIEWIGTFLLINWVLVLAFF